MEDTTIANYTSALASSSASAQVPQQHGARTTSTTLAHLSDAHFRDLGLSPNVLAALSTVFGYEVCTDVQKLAIPPALEGKDVMAKAKTGTGKTLGFLTPVIDHLERHGPRSLPGGNRKGISVVVLSPTRELAQQIANEAEMLVRTQTGRKLTVQTVVGGTNIKSDLRGLQGNNPPDLLIATPGRLNDHLQNSGLGNIFDSLQFVIMDEADRLLDMGFRPEIERILSKLPSKEQRQTLLFSATYPRDVKALSDLALRRDHAFIDTIGDEETETNRQVDQFVLKGNHDDLVADLYHNLDAHIRENPNDFKIMVFFVTARLTQLYSEIFNRPELNFKRPSGQRISVLEMHSRKSQGHRTKVANAFRDSLCQVCFSSDVSARGMDYPDVSMVIQVGIASDRDQYVHRLGRTARAGKRGVGLLLLQHYESYFLTRKISDLPVQDAPASMVPDDEWKSGFLSGPLADALAVIPDQTKSASYQAWLGFYNSNLRDLGWSQQDLVDEVNVWSASAGGLNLQEPPALLKRTVGKMGLKNVKGLRTEAPGAQQGRGGGRGGGGGGGRGAAAQPAARNYGRGGAIQGAGYNHSSSDPWVAPQDRQSDRGYGRNGGGYGGNRGGSGGYGGGGREIGTSGSTGYGGAAGNQYGRNDGGSSGGYPGYGGSQGYGNNNGGGYGNDRRW